MGEEEGAGPEQVELEVGGGVELRLHTHTHTHTHRMCVRERESERRLNSRCGVESSCGCVLVSILYIYKLIFTILVVLYLLSSLNCYVFYWRALCELLAA